MAAGQKKRLEDEFKGAQPLTPTKPMVKWEKEGQRLRGTFVRIRDGALRNQRILMLNEKDGPVEVSCPTTLENALAGVKPGTEVVIQYDGEDTVNQKANQNALKLFQVVALK